MFSKHLSDSIRHPRDVLSGLNQQKDVLIPPKRFQFLKTSCKNVKPARKMIYDFKAS
jgi:hypothetical protein